MKCAYIVQYSLLGEMKRVGRLNEVMPAGEMKRGRGTSDVVTQLKSKKESRRCHLKNN